MTIFCLLNGRTHDKLLFVEWKDTREVMMCSSFHSANGNQTVQRRVKTPDGQWVEKTVPIPAAVSDYNKNMGGVDMSDALIGYYTVLRKTRKWYRSLFYHFVDIAVVNAFIIQQQLAKMKQKKAKSQREFREALVSQLADWMPPPAPPASSATPAPPDSQHDCHKPKHISNSKRAFRRKSRMCHMKTPVFCPACDAALCFLPERDCFNNWHDKNSL
ncbi:piggyBac transposable element-derived protein 4-like [Cyprinus carpio]|uniref:PiggyBac transposable element-derived protein 4-like n=1 Tax=Cyprinus carpio TaxID=7962 RepID=A0A9R0AVC5_CYPCA|nr:piggyBac transposable element-derived protein 4-like [Cyprinus carpio]